MFKHVGMQPVFNKLFSTHRSASYFSDFLFIPTSFLSSSVHLHSAAMPSDLEKAMESMIMVFHKYASKDGSTNTLSRRELKDLMENELAGFLKVA